MNAMYDPNSASQQQQSVRTLLLLRHAKSAWPEGILDPQRPLNSRGCRDAPAAGRWIADAVPRVDQVICSPALRTRQTAELVMSAWANSPPIVYDDRVYEAHWTQLSAVIAGLSDDLATVVLIGHNPGLADLASSWPDSATDEAQRTLHDKFPTSAIAWLEVAGSWRDPQSRHLRQIAIPRG